MGKMGIVQRATMLCLLAAVAGGCNQGELTKKNVALETAIKGLTAEKQAQQRELARLKSANDQLAGQVDTSKQRVASLEKENSRLSHQVVQLSHAQAGRRKAAARPARPKQARKPTTAPLKPKAEAPFQVAGTTVTQEPGRVKVRLSNSLLFDAGKAKLKTKALATLDQIGRILKTRYPKSVVGIEGHTDTTPIRRSKKLYTDNHDLSVRRARAVFDYLKSKGQVADTRLFVAGYGPIRPEGTNKTRQGRAQNRRVEIVVYTQ